MSNAPAVLVADTGALVGVMTETGRALSKPRGGGFIASIWLENDGDGVDQKVAAARWPAEPGRVRYLQAGTTRIVHVQGKRAAATFDNCASGLVVVVSVPLALSGPCAVYDPKRLRKTGSLAISDQGIVTARTQSGQRLWNTQQFQRAPRLARR